jgi:hypothetical protein
MLGESGPKDRGGKVDRYDFKRNADWLRLSRKQSWTYQLAIAALSR